ncbi:MAG: FAD-binding protein [Acidiferrobacterales bacterium]|nr:FAD-binding protein [Acidiferrobacterales bacterium]
MSIAHLNQKAPEDYAYPAAIAALQSLFGERVLTSNAIREQFGKDESFHPSKWPHAVIKVHTSEEVQQIVRICAEHKTPIIPHGAGTSLEGNIAALKGGVTIDTSEMNNIVAIHNEDFDVVVQPGVTRRQLNEYLRDTGMFFPIDPGANASIGGMASTRASGTNAVRYGTMRENVLSVEAVLADGSIIRTANRAVKSAAGYDLTRLLVGSEGTLAMITEITLKVYPIPEAISAAVCTFESIEDAVNSVIQIIQYGIPIARVELLDSLTMKSINLYSKTDYAESPTLFLEFHGSEAGVQEQSELTEEITSENGGSNFSWTSNTEERNKMWRARHDVAYAGKLLHPKGEIWSTDVCVPISRLADCIGETRKDIEESGLLAPLVGHVGDGNFHLLLLVDHENESEVAAAEALHRRMVIRALEMDGTCTGEHGIGYGKIEFLEIEHGAAVTPMKMIKKTLDPDNLFNPGKIFGIL